MYKICIVVFNMAFASVAFSASPDVKKLEDINFKKITQVAMQQAIIPGHALFAENAEILQNNIRTVCTSGGLVSNVKQVYLETAMTWAGIEWINFGPITVNDRKMRVSFFPDKHNVGARQLRKAIQAKSNVLLADIESGKASYALQGLRTLDKILFKYEIDKNPYACKMALAVAGNITRIATELNRAWTEEFSELYGQNTSPEDALENGREMLEGTRLFLQIIRDHKLGRPLNGDKRVKASAVEYGSSGYSLLALKVNAIVVYKGLNTSLSEVLSTQERKRFYTVTKSLLDKIDNAPYSLKTALKKDKKFVKLLYDDINVMLILYDKMLTKYFGFKQAFNSLDGD